MDVRFNAFPLGPWAQKRPEITQTQLLKLFLTGSGQKYEHCNLC